MIAACSDTMAHIWNVHDDATEPRTLSVGAIGAALACPRSGNALAIGCLDGSVRFADRAANKVAVDSTTWATTTEHFPAFSRDGTHLVTQGQDGLVHVWETNTRSLVGDLPHPDEMVTAAEFSPNGRLLATSSNAGIVRIWALDSTHPRVTLDTTEKHAHELLAFSPDGSLLATGGTLANKVRLLNTGTGQFKELSGHTNGLIGMVFSPDGKKVATSGLDNTVRFWGTETGTQGATLPSDTAMFQLSFSPDGGRLATVGGVRARVWDVATAKSTDLPSKTPTVLQFLKFSRDGKRLVSAGDYQTIKVWDAQTLELLHDLPGLQLSTLQLDFSPDGKNVLTAGRENSARIWELETGTTVKDLAIGAGIVTAAYRAQGTQIIATDVSNAAKVWDARTGTLVSAMGHTVVTPVKSLVFRKDSKSVVAAHTDGKVSVWDAQTRRTEERAWPRWFSHERRGVQSRWKSRGDDSWQPEYRLWRPKALRANLD